MLSVHKSYSKIIFWIQKVPNMFFKYCFTIIFIKLISCISDIFVFSTHISTSSVLCPSSCYCDDNGEYVSCVGDGLWRFPMEIPNTTIRLELRNYLVKELSADDFTQLIYLEELKFQQSKIESISNNTFASNTKLEKLDFSQNALTFLGFSMFKNLKNLHYLDLSSNFVEFLDDAFAELVNLEQLNLRDNKLQQLTTDSFEGLHKVQYLNLDSNNISLIEVGTFQYLTNLAHLIISNNPLTTLSRLDFFGSRLQYIDISHVGLDRIPQSLTKFVRDLRLAKNNLTHISAGDFDSYPYLGLLVLDDNCVSEIENDALGRQEYLMRLWLNGNCLTKVPPNLPSSLLALYMEENKLSELPSYSFKGLVRLEQLFLQRNEIKQMSSCAFCDLTSLKSLDLQANQIENLTAGVFSNLTNLQSLDLSQNNLKYIDFRCFDNLPHLTTLQMSRVHSEIEIDDAVFDPLHSLKNLEVYDSSILVHTIINSTRMLHGLRNIEELNIMHNRIEKLRSDFPSFFPNIKIIKISGNLWHCDENIKWLSNWIKQSNVQFYSSYNIRCATPQSVLYKPLMMLTESDFTTTTEIPTESSVEIDRSAIAIVTLPGYLPGESFNKTSSESTPLDSVTSSSGTPVEKRLISSTEDDLENESSQPYQREVIESEGKQKKNSVLSTETYKIRENTTAGDYSAINAQVSRTGVHSSTSEKTHPSQSVGSRQYEDLPVKAVNVSTEYVSQNASAIQTVSPQRRVLFSRLRVAPQSSDANGWDQRTMIVISATLSGGCVLFVIIALTAFTCFRLRHRYQPVKHRNMRRSSSISYYPQKDEVSIVTLTEGTVGLRTTSHHGLGNKLYYIMENGGNTPDPSTEALPDSQLQELLPQTSKDLTQVY